ncbi:T9SS type A sorting domain-containing protein [Hyunsoonleella flava]|nr:T9SS type A sorting domain-containing protein [Hyunsoonleella flava]
MLNLLNGQDIDNSSWILSDFNINSESHASLISDFATPIKANFQTNSDKYFFSTSPCDTSSGEIILDKENATFTFLIIGTTLGGCNEESGDKSQLLQEIVTKHNDFYNFYNSGTSFRYQILEENENAPKTLVLINSNNDSATYFIDVLSLSGNTSVSSFSIHPNPVQDNITITSKVSIENAHCTILNISGKIIKSYNGLNENTINVSALEKGMYFIKITTDNTTVITKKFVKI